MLDQCIKAVGEEGVGVKKEEHSTVGRIDTRTKGWSTTQTHHMYGSRDAIIHCVRLTLLFTPKRPSCLLAHLGATYPLPPRAVTSVRMVSEGMRLRMSSATLRASSIVPSLPPASTTITSTRSCHTIVTLETIITDKLQRTDDPHRSPNGNLNAP